MGQKTHPYGFRSATTSRGSRAGTPTATTPSYARDVKLRAS